MPASSTTSGLTTAAGQQRLAPVLVAVAGPARQSRLTVLLRLFLVLPHLVVLAFAGVAAFVLAIIGWFAALFTGELPGFVAEFEAGYLRWQTRVTGYAILLTDGYPPFSMQDADYPVRVAVAPGPLNRLAVLFRIFLLIPCLLLQEILAYGAFTVAQIISWVIVLIRGEMPAALHQALAAVLRFQARTSGYGLMLTSAYPGALFGDPETPWSPTGPTRFTSFDLAQGYGAQDYPDQEPPSWQLHLSGTARKVVGAFIVFGLMLVAAGGSSAAVLATTNAVKNNAETQLQADITPVRNTINAYSTSSHNCKGKLSCVQGLDRQVAAALNTFAGKVRTIEMPSTQAKTGANNLASSATQTAALFIKLAGATSATQYINMANSGNLNQAVQNFNDEYLLLGGMLAH
jgi:hypothetical protein